MKWKYYVLAGLVSLVIIVGIIYSLTDSNIVSSNDIFTDEIYDRLVQIEYWNGGTRLIISKEEDIRSFYSNLSSLTLRKPGPFDSQKFGHLIMNLVLEDETISIGLLSGEILVNGEKYYTDKDICDEVRTIALKYEDYYNNNVFTESLYDRLVEIDCWSEDTKSVIIDADRLERVYHYLSRLSLEKASPDYSLPYDPMRIDILTDDSVISFGITSKVICLENEIYYTDSTRDLVQLITSIAGEKE